MRRRAGGIGGDVRVGFDEVLVGRVLVAGVDGMTGGVIVAFEDDPWPPSTSKRGWRERLAG
jgi:hypothetical protein